MNFWDWITGNDMTRDWEAFEARAAELPADHRAAWDEIKNTLWLHGDFTGRNLTPIADGALGLLESTAADGQSIQEALGDDITGFCAAIAGNEAALDFRDKWRDQLNRTVARKLSKLEA